MAWILQWDRTLNAIPSLHAGFHVYVGALAWRMFRATLPKWVFAGGALWGAAILYATLATRQHYAVDLAAGVLLGAAASAWAWKDASEAAATMLRSNGVASHDGAK
jgi:membrane-associated phospholipid phosphatase